jgi:hypothetical protein
MYRTNIVDSTTAVYRQGMKEWLPMFKVEKLRTTLMDASSELLQVAQIK